MAKKIIKKLKLAAISAGKATPAPPTGPVLGQAKVNIGEFVTRFNEATRAMAGEMIPVEVVVYEDKTFKLNLKTPVTSGLILKAAGKEKGAGKNTVSKAGSITRAQLKAIAEKKMPDLNSADIEGAMKVVAGTARSMGIDIKG